MSAEVLFQGSTEIAVIVNTFTLASTGVPTDPTAVSIIITDPAGGIVTHTYQGASPNDVVRNSAGVYQLSQPCTIEGLWSYTWIGTGVASDVTPGTFTVTLTALGRLYCSVEELKSRIGLDQADTSDDDQLYLSVQAAARGIDQFTGRYFWQATDTRVFAAGDIEMCPVDDLVSVTSFATDSNGLGVYDTTWATTDYRLEPFNAPTPSPEAEPYTRVRALAGGGGRYFFPWAYAMSNPDRVKITGVYGWPAVPYLVKQAALQLAEDVYKLKDAPFGVMGGAELGMIRVKANPQLAGSLWSYVRGRGRVGV